MPTSQYYKLERGISGLENKPNNYCSVVHLRRKVFRFGNGWKQGFCRNGGTAVLPLPNINDLSVENSRETLP